MNEFIKLRSSIGDYKNPYIFPLLLLDRYLDNSETINLKETILIKKIQKIKRMEVKKTLKASEIDELFLFLGENKYLDRYLIDCLLNFFNSSSEEIFRKIIKETIADRKFNNQKLYHLLDICIESKLNILDEGDISFIFENYKLDLDIISIAIDYLDSFSLGGFKDTLYELLKNNYPDNIKMQILSFLFNFYPKEKIDESFLREKIRTDKNKLFYDNYMDFLKGDFKFKKKNFVILQSMFYGDFEDSGKGNNGGLAVLLKTLGDEISKADKVSSVLTISTREVLDRPFLSYYRNKHIFVRLPIYIDKTKSDPFIKRELFIKRYIGKFLKNTGIDPDVFHIRYLDNASKAIADLSKEKGKKFVFTLAPDPHRNMFDEKGDLKDFSFSDLMERLNKIKIGDELIYKSDGIIGIGNKEVREELEIYFPQFKEKTIKKKVKMIGEGIQTNIIYEDDINLSEFAIENGLDSNFFEKPIILNVGRLAIQKGQIELLKAWTSSKLSKTHNLLIIGGDVENPNREEKKLINFFESHIKANPDLKDRFFHKSALANESIKLLERTIAKREFDYPHLYICSSIKEEFGIAILEAMSQGFLVLGPQKGGVRTYIENGKNGFLIDTTNFKTIARDSEKYIYDSKFDRDKFTRIQEAGKKTVEKNYSMNKIAGDFLSFYLSLKGEDIDEI